MIILNNNDLRLLGSNATRNIRRMIQHVHPCIKKNNNNTRIRILLLKLLGLTCINVSCTAPNLNTRRYIVSLRIA